jgi:hypothetical protein
LIVRRLLGQDGKPRMPMGFAPLPDALIFKLRSWIDAGADLGEARRARHWAYAPPRRPELPKVKARHWVRNPIDLFVLARLEKEGLSPSPEAPRESLARRVFLDLTGLPPSVEELDRFLEDRRSGAYERLVDRLLADPHYGEKMARAWLDLARYADTNGYEKDLPRQMWLWRDWVIDAFNRNLPYDRFTVEQLAGDLLPNPSREQLIATGFHRNSMLNDEGGIDPEEFRVVAVKDRVDATAVTWLGVTLACAECHDHKYDPFTQRDYYRMFAYFDQTEDNGRDMDPRLKVPSPEQERELKKLETEIESAKRELLARTPSVLAEAPQWESRFQSAWTILKPVRWESQATLTLLADASLLASGRDPEQDEYVVWCPLRAGPITGLRIEAIPDPSLPEGSSGRNFNGNFVLSGVEARVIGRGGAGEPDERPLQFASAAADFTQSGHDPKSVIPGAGGEGWAIAGFLPEHRVPHTLQLWCERPVFAREGDTLVIRLAQRSKHAHHNLGRFRISVTSDPEIASQTPPSAAVRSALSKRPEERTEPEAEAVRAHYAGIAPDLVELRARISALGARRAEIDGSIPTVMVMRRAHVPRVTRLLLRGDFRTPGDPVFPGPPRALGGWSPRSDRLGLAMWLVDPRNPLTARVEVNRLWEQCFGRGLVATPEDFGTQGERPSHPELLDWLATEFVARKWDVRAMLRLIVTSATYRQDSSLSTKSKRSNSPASKDPENVLLSRGPRFRLAAEEVRDVALKASGRLTPTIGGPSVFPPQPPGIWENSFSFYDTKDRWVEDQGPNRYRRGLYTYWRRTAPHPMALNFDLRSRDTCVSRRSRTNTPLQALNTLNDPLFVECAGALGKAMCDVADRARARDRAPWGPPKDIDKWDDAGLVYGFRACTSRKPKDSELNSLRRLLRDARANFTKSRQNAAALLNAARLEVKIENAVENAAWTVVANTLLNLDETLTKG